ncbi:hypothetical protein L5M11_11320 [Shewanella sp. SM87]|uniref:hypothetical protein n=1 Tax=unclassified Shewanella TaxID=196818 RepID=UPI0021DAB217|nr:MULTISPECIES: hypothetical protein [unclassified Shewanella]MCU8008100.1 hypothetical protein [Shewanella sp. SM87]
MSFQAVSRFILRTHSPEPFFKPVIRFVEFCPLTPSCHDELKNYKALLELLITGNVFDGRRHSIT